MLTYILLRGKGVKSWEEVKKDELPTIEKLKMNK